MPNQNSFYVIFPDFPTRGESSGAYIQRSLAILLAIVCVGFSISNWFNCKTIKITLDRTEFNTNATSTVSKIGIGLVEILGGNVSSFDDTFARLPEIDCEMINCDDYKNLPFIYFGQYGYAFILDYENVDHQIIANATTQQQLYNGECMEWDWDFEFDTQVPKHRQIYLKVSRILREFTIIFGGIGIIFALIEFCFCIFYPSVVLSAIFLTLSAITEIVAVGIDFYEAIECIALHICVLQSLFYEEIVCAVGFFIASCMILFGPRTYPINMRKYRDPNNCQIIDPEIVHEINHEIDNEDDIDIDVTAATFIVPSIPLDIYNKLHDELMETKQALVATKDKLAISMDRAETAEASLTLLTKLSSTLATVPRNNDDSDNTKNVEEGVDEVGQPSDVKNYNCISKVSINGDDTNHE